MMKMDIATTRLCRDDMSPGPRVSVITIFLNAERFIAEAIESVFAQSFDDWELLLVDDGSTDASTEIALSYAREFPHKVRYLEHEGHRNSGMSASRNLGISRAAGSLIAFLDADDVWLPRKLEQQVEILDSTPEAGMVYGRTHYWYSWTGKAEDSARDFVPDTGVPPDSLIKPPALLPVLLQNQIVTTTGSLARREVIEAIGGFEQSFRGLHEDQVFYAKLCLSAPIYVASDCWYKYRKHPDSCCSVAESAGRNHSERLTFLDWLGEYLLEQGIEDRQIKQAIKKERWKSRHPVASRLSADARYRVLRMKNRLKSIARQAMPASVYNWLRARRAGVEPNPSVGAVAFGNLRRVTPISRVFGYDRGQPVDRYYIENFLQHHSNDIRGRVLEIGDASYTRRFGGTRVTRSDVLHVEEGNPQATIVADLTSADNIPSDSFDCIVLTQTLHLVYDVRAAINTLHRILKPGGVLLTTFPGISQIDHYDWGATWYWAFTCRSARRMFAEVFPESNLTLEAHGNVLAAISFLHGLASEELSQKELDHRDSDYEVTITLRAIKPERPL